MNSHPAPLGEPTNIQRVREFVWDDQTAILYTDYTGLPHLRSLTFPAARYWNVDIAVAIEESGITYDKLPVEEIMKSFGEFQLVCDKRSAFKAQIDGMTRYAKTKRVQTIGGHGNSCYNRTKDELQQTIEQYVHVLDYMSKASNM